VSDEPEGRVKSRGGFTIPNVLAVFRLLASPGLVFLGAAERRTGLLLLFLLLTATDWIDGKLAVWLDQRTALGSRLDSLGDGVMYGSLLLGLGLLMGDRIVAEWPWIAPACLTYLASLGAGVLKFGALPSYHTAQAKASWLLALLSGVAILVQGWIWPLRVTALAVTATNVEALLITRALDRPREDVPSIFHLPSGEGEPEEAAPEHGAPEDGAPEDGEAGG